MRDEQQIVEELERCNQLARQFGVGADAALTLGHRLQLRAVVHALAWALECSGAANETAPGERLYGFHPEDIGLPRGADVGPEEAAELAAQTKELVASGERDGLAEHRAAWEERELQPLRQRVAELEADRDDARRSEALLTDQRDFLARDNAGRGLIIEDLRQQLERGAAGATENEARGARESVLGALPETRATNEELCAVIVRQVVELHRFRQRLALADLGGQA